MSEDNRFTFRMDADSKEKLKALAQSWGLENAEVLRQLIIIGYDCKVWREDWKEKITKDVLSLYSEKEKIRIQGEEVLFDLHESSKEKDRQQQKEIMLLDRYLKSRTEEERRKWFDDRIREIRVLNSEEYSTLPVLQKDGKITVSINGKSLTVNKIRDDGLPELEFNQDRLVKCLTGFHTSGSWCSPCPEVNSCMILRRERLEGFSRK